MNPSLDSLALGVHSTIRDAANLEATTFSSRIARAGSVSPRTSAARRSQTSDRRPGEMVCPVSNTDPDAVAPAVLRTLPSKRRRAELSLLKPGAFDQLKGR
jgi:hypothetical protein